MNGVRALALTDKGLRAIGVEPTRYVPPLDVPMRPDEKDRK